MKLTKKIKAIQAWPEERKQKVFSDICAIVDLPKNQTTVKCSAFVCQVTEILWG
jgi:hypothetical protein